MPTGPFLNSLFLVEYFCQVHDHCGNSRSLKTSKCIVRIARHPVRRRQAGLFRSLPGCATLAAGAWEAEAKHAEGCMDRLTHGHTNRRTIRESCTCILVNLQLATAAVIQCSDLRGVHVLRDSGSGLLPLDWNRPS